MFLLNRNADYRKPLDPADAETLGVQAADEVERFLSWRDNVPTPLHSLPALAAELGVGAIHLKDEGFRLGLGSFKALGGAYAVVRLVLEEASAATRPAGRPRRAVEPERPRGGGGHDRSPARPTAITDDRSRKARNWSAPRPRSSSMAASARIAWRRSRASVRR